MANLQDIVNLCRVRQWYKNLVIFLALFFVGSTLHIPSLITTSLGFLALCLASSSNYIINDLLDRKKDRLHPEKCHRPLAKKTITLPTAFILASFLLLSSLVLAFTLSTPFALTIISLIILTHLYSLLLKHIVLLDILTIATLFVIRAISGAILLNVIISPWLILCPFFLSLFLSTSKRHANLLFLKENATKTRSTLKYYTPTITSSLMIISTTLLILSYALYSFLSIHKDLLLTLPIALYVIFFYLLQAQRGSIITRHPEKAITKLPLLIGTLLWVIATFIIIYF